MVLPLAVGSWNRCSSRSMHILIVGAGMAGVGTGVVAVRAGLTVTIVDRKATVGGLWGSGGHYPQARLQEDGSCYRFPGHPFPSAVQGFPAASDVADYVRSVAVRGGLRREHFRLSTSVSNMTWVPGDCSEKGGGSGAHEATNGDEFRSGSWDVTLVPMGKDKDELGKEVLRVDWVVVASGHESGPPTAVPDIDDAGVFGGRILNHCDTYGMNVEELLAATGIWSIPSNKPSKGEPLAKLGGEQVAAASLPKSVVIVGNGKTALDLAMTLTDIDKGVTAHVVASRSHWMMPYSFFGLIPSLPLLYMRAAGVASPSWTYTTPIARTLAGPLWPLAVLWGLILAAIVRASVGWRRELCGGGAECGRDLFRNSFCMIPIGFLRRLWSRRIIMHAPDEVVAAAGVDSLRLASGKVLPATAVLSCRGTNHRSSLAAFLPAPDLDALFAEGDGLRLYRHLVHPDVAPQVAFVATGHSFALGTVIHMQALWLVELWAGRLALPPRQERRDEMNRVANVKQVQLGCNRDLAGLILDRFYPYLDELCMDLGVEPIRAGLTGYFTSFDPDWYASVEGELRHRQESV